MQEQELFQSYEVKNWDFSLRIYKVLAVSAIVNILALLIVGQTNLLTKKGCDSPLVGRVCQVIDTLYVGSKILTTESDTGEVDYTKTEISPDDEIIFVNVADKLYYPEGYFALSNPELAQINPDGTFPTDGNDFQNIPGIPNPTTNGGGGGLFNQLPELPKDNPNAVNGKIPDSPYSVGGGNPTINYPKNQKQNRWKNPKIPQTSPKKLPKLSPDTMADVNTDNQNGIKNITPTPSPTPDKDDVSKEDNNGIFRNKKPLKDFAKKATVEVKKVKLDAPFEVTISADLDFGKDGKTVVLKNPKPIKTDNNAPNDPAMAKLAQDAILAIGDSGWLGYLKTVAGVKKIVFTLSQDENSMVAKILGDQKDENTAKTNASGLNALRAIGLNATDGDEKILLDKATITSEGKSIILNFVIPKKDAQEMITRKLKEAEEKEAKPNSAAQIAESNKTSGK